MTSIQFLLFAENLLKDTPHAALCRSAVSRAYYSAFHYVKEFIESAGVTILTDHQGHTDVRNHLASLGDIEIEKIGNDIAALRVMRNEADYKLSESRLERGTNAEREVAKARGIIETIDRCKKEHARYTSVQVAIRKTNQTLRGLISR